MSHIVIHRCGAIRDAAGCNTRPGAVAVDAQGMIQAVGSPEQVQIKYPQARHDDTWRHRLVLPAMVNAHAHLDLTLAGRQPYRGDFLAWVRQVMQHRGQLDDQAIAQAVTQGLAMLARGGVGWVGDVAGSLTAASIVARAAASPPAGPQAIQGVSFLECFGHGPRWQPAIEQAQQSIHALAAYRSDRWQIGIQPHAPYSAGPRLYQAAIDLAKREKLRLATHLAENDPEAQFVRDAQGPFAEQLKAWDKWDASIKPTGLHPADWMAPMLRQAPWLLAHCNQLDDAHLDLLAEADASVVYCPVASDYYGHHGHRYRDLLAAGVNVALGSDSVLCQSPDDPLPLSTLSQMRHLYQRDRTDPDTLLAMATVNGLKALGLDPRQATLQVGVMANMVSWPMDPEDQTDPLVQLLRM